MSKLIARQKPEQIVQQAQYYVKSYILLPSGVVGLICMVGGVGGLGYQLLATDNYTWGTFYQSTGLIVLGVVMGIVQTRYHQFLLAQFPEVLAARMRTATAKKGSKVKKDSDIPVIDHQGRQLIPAAYTVGAGVILGSSWFATMMGQVDVAPALLLPWAGFYWARLFFWRGRV